MQIRRKKDERKKQKQKNHKSISTGDRKTFSTALKEERIIFKYKHGKVIKEENVTELRNSMLNYTLQIH